MIVSPDFRVEDSTKLSYETVVVLRIERMA